VEIDVTNGIGIIDPDARLKLHTVGYFGTVMAMEEETLTLGSRIARRKREVAKPFMIQMTKIEKRVAGLEKQILAAKDEKTRGSLIEERNKETARIKELQAHVQELCKGDKKVKKMQAENTRLNTTLNVLIETQSGIAPELAGQWRVYVAQLDKLAEDESSTTAMAVPYGFGGLGMFGALGGGFSGALNSLSVK